MENKTPNRREEDTVERLRRRRAEVRESVLQAERRSSGENIERTAEKTGVRRPASSDTSARPARTVQGVDRNDRASRNASPERKAAAARTAAPARNTPSERNSSSGRAVSSERSARTETPRTEGRSGNVQRDASARSARASRLTAEEKAARREKKEQEKKVMKRRRRNVLIVMGETVLLLVLCIACYGVTVLGKYNHSELDPGVYIDTSSRRTRRSTEIRTSYVEHTNESGEVVSVEQVTIPPDEDNLNGYRNILILGLAARDMYNFEGDGVNSDVMIIASINNDTGDIKMASVLRDTIMRMEDGTGLFEYQKANNQFAQSGISDTVSMLNRNLGLDIQEYVCVNWYGVAACINQMGGVELTLENQRLVSYFNGYLTAVCDATGLWGQQLWEPGTYNMNGPQAVAYCRIRYGGYEDEGRANHHREVIQKLFQKAKVMLKNGQVVELIDVAKTGLSNVKTNLNLPEILYMMTELDTYNIGETCNFPFEHVDGEYVGNYYQKYHVTDVMVAPDFAGQVKRLHQFLFNDYEYEPSQFIKDISYQMYLDMNGK